MAKQTHWPRPLKNPFTLRITAADVIDSQLTPEDLKVFEGAGGVGEVGELCPDVYCVGGYCGERLTADAVINPADTGS